MLICEVKLRNASIEDVCAILMLALLHVYAFDAYTYYIACYFPPHSFLHFSVLHM